MQTRLALLFLNFKMSSAVKPDSADANVIFPNDVKNEVREIGEQAIWSLSSCKPGFGIDQLRDNNFDTYWQSDGPQPHLISIQFRFLFAFRIFFFKVYSHLYEVCPFLLQPYLFYSCRSYKCAEKFCSWPNQIGWFSVEIFILFQQKHQL